MPRSTRKKKEIVNDHHDMPWNQTKIRLFTCLKKLGAVDLDTAVTSRDIINQSGERLSPRDVRRYSYGAMTIGLIKVVMVSKGRHGYLFHLTKEGVKINPEEEYRKQVSLKKD